MTFGELFSVSVRLNYALPTCDIWVGRESWGIPAFMLFSVDTVGISMSGWINDEEHIDEIVGTYESYKVLLKSDYLADNWVIFANFDNHFTMITSSEEAGKYINEKRQGEME